MPYSALPEFSFTVETSELLIEPLTLTSLRKFDMVAVLPLCALVWLMSVLFTLPLLVVSPSKKLTGMTTLPALFTSKSVMLIVCALATPLRLIVMSLPAVLVPDTVPTPDVTDAELRVTGAAKETTTW